MLILIVAAGLYAVNLNNGLFWDDDDWIVNNVSIHGIDWTYIKFWFTNNTLAGIGLTSNYYRPFLFFTFAINYVIGGTNPIGYHIVSNLIHLANGLLIFLLLNRAFTPHLENADKGFSWAALLTALVFLIHPVQTEAVSYISGRGDPLNVFFMLLALWLFLGAQARQASWLHWRRWGSLVSLALALLSRETAIIFPLLLVVWQVAFGPRLLFWQSFKRALRNSWSYFGIVMLYGLLRLTVLNFENTLNFYTAQNVYSENLLVRLYTFMNSLLLYFKLLLVPTGLHMERSMPVFTSLWLWPVWAVLLGVMVLAGWLWWLYRQEKRNRLKTNGPSDFRIWLFGVGWFFIALGPVSGITPINALFYEHWLYLPLVGFFTILFFYGERLWLWLAGRRQLVWQWLLGSLLVAYLIFFGTQTVRRNLAWGDPIAFFEGILKYESGSARVLNNLGNLYYDKGDLVKSVDYYEQAIAVGDIFPQPHFNLGAIQQAQGDYYGAIKQYEAALQLDPNFYYPYPNLINIYVGQGNYPKALEYAQKLRQIRPDDPRVYYNLALIQKARGDRAAAAESIRQGLARSQYDAQAKQWLEDLAKTL